MTYKEALKIALDKGADAGEIERASINYRRQVGSTPFDNMIRALQMHSWSNSADDWGRLAAALGAKLAMRGLTKKAALHK